MYGQVVHVNIVPVVWDVVESSCDYVSGKSVGEKVHGSPGVVAESLSPRNRRTVRIVDAEPHGVRRRPLKLNNLDPGRVVEYA